MWYVSKAKPLIPRLNLQKGSRSSSCFACAFAPSPSEPREVWLCRRSGTSPETSPLRARSGCGVSSAASHCSSTDIIWVGQGLSQDRMWGTVALAGDSTSVSGRSTKLTVTQDRNTPVGARANLKQVGKFLKDNLPSQQWSTSQRPS